MASCSPSSRPRSRAPVPPSAPRPRPRGTARRPPRPAGAGAAGQRGEPLDPLLRCEPADVADQQLTRRREPSARRAAPAGSVRCRGWKPVGVDPSPPELDPAEPAAAQVGQRRGRRREGEVGQVVDAAQPAPRRPRRPRRAGGRRAKPGDVGLEHGDAWGRPARRATDSACAPSANGRGRVHDVGLEGQRGPRRSPRGHAEREARGTGTDPTSRTGEAGVRRRAPVRGRPPARRGPRAAGGRAPAARWW